MDLTGRTALVTGATGYLGRVQCSALARAGAHVIVNARKSEPASAFVAQLQGEGLSASAAVFDITDGRAVQAFVDAEFDGQALHILVNNATSGGGGTLATSSDDEFAQAYDITVVAAQRLIRLLLPALRAAKQRSGDAAIVNIASMYGIVSPDLRAYASAEGSNPPFYGAAKAGLLQLTRYVACELAAEGIRCNALVPGPFPNTQVQENAPDLVAKLIERVPMGRVGQPDELAGPLVFLASPAATYVTGAALPVDGGWMAW